jgi:Zn-dependent protease
VTSCSCFIFSFYCFNLFLKVYDEINFKACSKINFPSYQCSLIYCYFMNPFNLILDYLSVRTMFDEDLFKFKSSKFSFILASKFFFSSIFEDFIFNFELIFLLLYYLFSSIKTTSSETFFNIFLSILNLSMIS